MFYNINLTTKRKTIIENTEDCSFFVLSARFHRKITARINAIQIELGAEELFFEKIPSYIGPYRWLVWSPTLSGGTTYKTSAFFFFSSTRCLSLHLVGETQLLIIMLRHTHVSFMFNRNSSKAILARNFRDLNFMWNAAVAVQPYNRIIGITIVPYRRFDIGNNIIVVSIRTDSTRKR